MKKGFWSLIVFIMATRGSGSADTYSYFPQTSPLASGCIVFVEPDLDPSFSPDGTPLDSNWGTTYCRLRRASELIGASAVAIDNKIEQAMDLVKSHLMFAVREEVEQLKLKIQELTERNSQLEYENSILRASAPQETLAKLQRPQSTLPS